MDNTTTTPEYLFESSWEVCNKVGGIYTVLSTKAHTLQQSFKDKLIFIGPDVWTDTNAPDFIEDDVLFADWKTYTKTTENLKVKVGRWNVPGTPPVILVDFKPFFKEKDSFFFSMWESFRVDSIHAYGDYDESCIFAYAVGKVIESFYHFYKLENKKVAALFNEWMLGMGALYIKKQLPAVATLFTTHATSIGRSIAGNNKALYAYMDGYNGDQMAGELNMEAKHSLEKQTALHVDCFTTVSDITARECKQLLDKAPDIVTPNGFEPNFVPSDKEYDKKRMAARRDLLNVAEKLLGCPISPDAFLVSTSGRYEYRNKGIDVFIEAMNRVRTSGRLQREVVAFIMGTRCTCRPERSHRQEHTHHLPHANALRHALAESDGTGQGAELYLPCRLHQFSDRQAEDHFCSLLPGRTRRYPQQTLLRSADRYGCDRLSLLLRTLGIHSAGKYRIRDSDHYHRSCRFRSMG